LPAVRRQIRPIYREMGIIPAEGLSPVAGIQQ
jgi:hypothetical protein